MGLNGTLIVQAINFFIAYLLLRWLYFKPAIVQINQEQEINTYLKNTILNHSLIIEQKQQQQKEYLLECQHYCQEQMPSISKPDFLTVQDTASVEQSVYDTTQLEKLSNMITNIVVQRIDHVS